MYVDDKKNFETSNMEMIHISRAEYEKFIAERAYITQLEEQNHWLIEQMKLLNRRQFGSGSEKASDEVMKQMSLLFNEPEAYVSAQQKTKTAVKVHTRKRSSGSIRDIVPKDIPVNEVIHELSADQRLCTQCGSEMAIIFKEVHESLKIKPAEAILQRDIYYTYACKDCEQKNISTPVVKTPQEPVIISGSFASPEAVAYLATQKFVMYSPLYHLEQEWNRRGLMLSRQTMSNWLLRCSKDWFEPIYDVLHKQLVQCGVIHSDETPLQVLHEPNKTAQSKSSMWLYRTGSDAKHPIVLYEYQPGKSGKYPRKFLQGFHGYLQTDGAAYYSKIDNSISVGCWAHARRKFDEAIKAQSQENEMQSIPAAQGVVFLLQLKAV